MRRWGTPALFRPAPLQPQRRQPGASDAGFSMLEVVVSIGLIGVVMASLGRFYVGSMVSTSVQANRQAAIQVANDGLEAVRARGGSALLTGRDLVGAQQAWTAGLSGAVPGVKPHLDSTDPAWTDYDTAGGGLPVVQDATVGGLRYTQHFFVGRCWQPTAGGACTKTANPIALLRAIVAVTWSDKACPGSTCSYVAATLLAEESDDPLFRTNQGVAGLEPPLGPAPTMVDPGAQTNDVDLALSLQVQGSASVEPFTWTASGLPPGLSINSQTGRISGTPSVAERYDVTVRLTDGLDRAASAAFTWTINPPPRLTSPGDQVTAQGVAVSLSIPVTGGTAPLRWTATGLPTGLSIDDASGSITGTPAAIGTYAVTVAVVDKFGEGHSTIFGWTVARAIHHDSRQVNEVDTAIVPGLVVPARGRAPYRSWVATGLPAGLSIASTTGLITGTPTRVREVHVTVTAVDADGTVIVTTFDWLIRNA